VAENFNGVITLTGMGLGYTPLALLEKRPNLRHLAVLEPNVGVFLQALHALDLTSLFSDPRFILGIGPDLNIAAVMAPAHKALQLEGIHNLQHLPTFSLDPDVYKKIHQELLEHCSSFNIEGNTLGFMGRDFLENRLRHFNSIHHDRLLADLAGKGQGIPAILVAAGPSLDKNVHLLAKAKGKAVIIAADAALPTLIANGVIPDLVGAIDPLELIFEKVAAVAPQVHGTSLLCMSWVSSKMVKFFPAEQVFWCFGSKPIEAWMAGLLDSTMLTAGAGSVAHLDFLAAIIMGCSPIVLVGQDLAFSPLKSHASHAILQTRDLSNSLQEGNPDTVWLDGIDGGKVPSNRTFQNHKNHFEMMIRTQEGHYINATEGGAHITGTEVLPLRTVLERYCVTPVEVKKIIGTPDETDQDKCRERLVREFDKIATLGKKTILALDKIEAVSRSLWRHLDEIDKKRGARYRSFAELPPPIRKKLEELNKLSLRLDKETSIWPLLQEVTMAGLRRSEQLKHEINALANNPEQYMEWLRKNIERSLQVNEVRRQVLPLLTTTLADDVVFLQAEKKLLAAARRNGPADTGSMKELAQLYYESGNLNLARPLVEKLSTLLPEAAEVNFLRGWIAAHYTEYTKAEAFFAKAVATDPDYAARIASFRQHQGDAYVKYAAHFCRTDKSVARRLLAKGLIYAPEHAGLAQQLIALCNQTLNEIKKQQAGKYNESMKRTIDAWLADLAANDRLAAVIGPERETPFHRARGIILSEENDYLQGIEAFNNALRLTPDDPALHLALADMYFALEQYPQGIIHLDKAVSLDSNYAVYWEEIGDSLTAEAQHSEALAAYEKCFLILPERVHLLKKIGDCYVAQGQLEAAREAYSQLKNKMYETDTATNNVQ
jgi:Flp pilus assembly protein TadD